MLRRRRAIRVWFASDHKEVGTIAFSSGRVHGGGQQLVKRGAIPKLAEHVRTPAVGDVARVDTAGEPVAGSDAAERQPTGDEVRARVVRERAIPERA